MRSDLDDGASPETGLAEGPLHARLDVELDAVDRQQQVGGLPLELVDRLVDRRPFLVDQVKAADDGT